MIRFIQIFIVAWIEFLYTGRNKGTAQIFTPSTADIMYETMEAQLLPRRYFLFLNLIKPTEKDYTSITIVRHMKYTWDKA